MLVYTPIRAVLLRQAFCQPCQTSFLGIGFKANGTQARLARLMLLACSKARKKLLQSNKTTLDGLKLPTWRIVHVD